ncbi:MAG: hypothetical protein R3A79_20100 [Nannocystaceae bacterium]
MSISVASLLRPAVLSLLVLAAGCAGDDSAGDTESTGAPSSESAGADEDQRLVYCESRCGEAPPAEVCGFAPAGCIDSCVELGTTPCVACRFDQDLGWRGSMPCGFSPCAFADASSYEACAASCDAEGASCEFLLGGAPPAECADLCAAP